MKDINKIFKINTPVKHGFSLGPKNPVEDYMVPKVMNTVEGTIEKVPVNNNDITNKLYVDNAAAGLPTNPNILGSLTVAENVIAGSFIGYIDISGLDAIPQGVIPYGSLTAALPQGILPVGSIPSLDYLPQGVLPTGSLPSNIVITGSITAGSFIGYGGDLTGLPSGGLPQGVLPYGSLTAALPQGLLPLGSIPAIPLNSIDSPTADATFTMANKSIIFNFNNPAGDGNMELNASGAFSGDVLHVHQHTGNPGATNLIHAEAVDADVVPIRTDGTGTWDIIAANAGSFGGNLIAPNLTATNLTSWLPQGVIPYGSMTASLPQGQVPVGSLSAVIPQGIIPYGSVTASLPQGVLPAGSIADLSATYSVVTHNHTGSYLPEGQLPTGSMATHISTAGSVVTGDHAAGAGSVTPMTVNVVYGTGATPPTASTTTEGTLYIQYTA